MINKHPKANLRSYQVLLFETGLILSLLVMIAATKTHIESKPINAVSIAHIDPPVIIDVPQTITQKTPPPPVHPQVPVEVVNDKIIDDIIYLPEFDSPGLTIPLPPPPKIDDEETVYESFRVEALPEIIGGINKLYEHIEYPEMAQKAGIEGTVAVRFIVNKEGKIVNPEIIRSIGGGCDEEVLKALALIKFKPGIQNGRFVAVKMVQSVRFNLQN